MIIIEQDILAQSSIISTPFTGIHTCLVKVTPVFNNSFVNRYIVLDEVFEVLDDENWHEVESYRKKINCPNDINYYLFQTGSELNRLRRRLKVFASEELRVKVESLE